MSSRPIRRWVMCAGLLALSLGCHRNNYQDKLLLPKSKQSFGALTPDGKKPETHENAMWTTNRPAVGQGPMNGVPIEAAPIKKREGKGFSPDGEVAIADTHVAAALADPPAVNRDELLDMARMRYQKALKEDPENKGAMLGMARMYSGVEDYDRSFEMYEKYMKKYPKDADVPHEVALLYGRLKDWNGAVAWCEVALKIDPENRTYRKSMGFCLARCGRWEEAYAMLNQVMSEAQTRYCLARVMEHMKFPEQSRQQLVAALQVDPNCTEARDFLAELDRGYHFGSTNPAAAAPNPVMQTGYVQQR